MTTDDKAAGVLGAQRLHWEATLASRPEMFGRDASQPARFAVELFQREGVKRVLELGGGQGRDSLFFAEVGLSVHVLDYAQAGVNVIIDEFSEGKLPRRLHRVTLRKPG